MNNLLASGSTGNLILIIILLVACAIMFVLSYIKNKKYMSQQQDMQNNIKVGSKVLTKTFIYGTIEKITETTDGKIVLLKSGEGDNASYIEMNIEGIYSIDNKEEVVNLDETMEEQVEETAEEPVEEPVEEPKTTAKKSKPRTKKQ